jgi:hypothetical protein
VFTESLNNLHAIHRHHNYPGLSITPHYHHHVLFLQSISGHLEARIARGFSTILWKFRGKKLADSAVKLASTDFDTLPPVKTL